jgi:hypothetical protein
LPLGHDEAGGAARERDGMMAEKLKTAQGEGHEITDVERISGGIKPRTK